MKNLSVRTLLLFLSLMVTGAYAQQSGGRAVNVNIGGSSTQLYTQSHALVIGISLYNNGWPPLPGVKSDVVAVKTALEDSGFNVVLLQDASKEQIDKSISDFINLYGQQQDNRLLVYFAGHGYTVRTSYGDQLGYIVPVDAPSPASSLGAFQSKALEMAQIEIYAKRIQSKHALFLFDACFAGSLFDMRSAASEIITYKTTKPVRQFITSGAADEQVPDKSIFRRQFVEALTTSAADSDKDGYLTGSELGQFLQNKVVNYSYNTQHPQYGKIRNPNLDKGDFVFELASISNNSVQPTVQAVPPSLSTGTVEIAYGSILIQSDVAGTLYVDGDSVGSLAENSRNNVLNNITPGGHSLQLGDVVKQVSVYENQTASITFEAVRSSRNFTSKHAGISIDMVFVDGGTFQMGSYGYDDEKPVHSVTVSGFYIGKYEVTQAQWRAIMGNNTGKFTGCDNCPVKRVSWDDVQEFILKLNAQTGKSYRLPTEAEWEYAAGAGNSNANKRSGRDYESSIGAFAWYEGNSGLKTHPVGQKQPNALGLYDMSGNVWEWCNDWYRNDYYATSPRINPQGPSSGTLRVLRGGSWYEYASSCRVTSRSSKGPGESGYDIGFRLALSQ